MLDVMNNIAEFVFLFCFIVVLFSGTAALCKLLYKIGKED